MTTTQTRATRSAAAWRRAAAALIVAAALPGAHAAGSAEAGQAKAAVCGGCHGMDGNSPSDQWPKLAGQLSSYLVKQLRDFKDGRRKNDQMTPMAQPLSEQDMEDVAAYFASRKVAGAPAGKRELLALGEQLYQRGKGRPDVVPACIGCHGPQGSGNAQWATVMSQAPTVLAPAIGAQHPAYVANQLQAYKSGARGNDLAHVMRDVAGRLNEREILALAEYVATLNR
jgi:cytochrome c553